MRLTPNSLKCVSWSNWNAARCKSAAGCCSAVKFRRERRSSPIIGSALNKVSHVEGLVLRWNILSGHLATDSCFCTVPGIVMHIGQRTRHVLQSIFLYCLSSQGQVDIKTDRMSPPVVSLLGCSSLRNSTSPQLKPELWTGTSNVGHHHWGRSFSVSLLG